MSEVDECRAHHEVPDGLVIKTEAKTSRASRVVCVRTAELPLTSRHVSEGSSGLAHQMPSTRWRNNRQPTIEWTLTIIV